MERSSQSCVFTGLQMVDLGAEIHQRLLGLPEETGKTSHPWYVSDIGLEAHLCLSPKEWRASANYGDSIRLG